LKRFAQQLDVIHTCPPVMNSVTKITA